MNSCIRYGLAVAFFTCAAPSISFSAVFGDWLFNDGSGGIATDSSASGNHGTLVNFGNLDAGAGDPGDSGWTTDGRLAFDGLNDYVTTFFPLSSLSGTSFTLETLVSHDNPTQGWTPILGSSQTNTSNIFFFGKQMNQNAVHYNFAGLGSMNTNIAFADGQLHHLALVFDDSANTITLFVDFVQRFQQINVTGTLNTPSNLWIGGIGHNTGERWNGTADHIRISDSALTPAEFIPEPGTALLALTGLLAIGARRRRS